MNRNYRGYASISLCTAGDDSIPGFCNTNHRDKKDWHKGITDACKARINSEKEDPKSMYEKERQKYAQHLLSNVGLGMPTTCGYYLIYNENDFDEEKFVGYFMMPGLGCAVRLRSSYYNHFHGYSFDHFTAVPYVKQFNQVHFAHSGVNMMAWGASKIS